MRHDKPRTSQELRKFGFVMSVPLTVIGGFMWWKGNGASPFVLALAVLFALVAAVAPNWLRIPEKVWMKLAELMGAVMTRVILAVAFYFVLTPMGLLLRVLKKDLLDIRTENGRDSYWHPVEQDGPATRPEKPY